MEELLWEGIWFPNYALKSGLIMRSDQRILTEPSLSFVSLTANVIIALHMLRRLRETLDTGHSRYYLPDIVTMHFTHVPSHPNFCAQNNQVEKNSYSFQFNLQEYKD